MKESGEVFASDANRDKVFVIKHFAVNFVDFHGVADKPIDLSALKNLVLACKHNSLSLFDTVLQSNVSRLLKDCFVER